MAADWQVGTLVKTSMAAENVMSLTFSLPSWQPFAAGQHFDIRLTAPNGYQAERSYSIASAPASSGVIEYGVELLPDGEVSPYLWNLKTGAQVEMRGPIGGHFVWDTSMKGPLVLIGGGSGMVPLMSMLRHHMNNIDTDAGRSIVLMVSAKRLELVPYRQELEAIAAHDATVHIVITLTEHTPTDWKGYARRIDQSMLREVLADVLPDMREVSPLTYICGPTKFVEATAGNLLALGFDAATIKTERFGG